MDCMHVTIMVKNMEESIKFYEDIVGLTIDRRFVIEPDTEYCFLNAGGIQVELIYHDYQESFSYGEDISIGFKTDSLDEVLKTLEAAGIKPLSEIISPNPHVKFFFVSDPDGVKIQFLEVN